MSQKKDAFADDLKTFFRILGNLLYTSAVAESVTKHAVSKGRKDLKEWKAEGKQPNRGMHELSTVIGLPNYIIDSEYVTYTQHERREASDEELYRIMEEVEKRLQAQALCEIFETLESFLRRAYATYLFHARNERFPDVKPTFDGTFRSHWKKLRKKPAENTQPYYRAYVEWLAPSCEDCFREFRQKLPYFQGKSGKRLEGLATNAADIEFCRHRIVHAHGQYDPDELMHLSRHQRRNVKAMTRKSVLTGEPTLLPSNESIRSTVSGFSGIVLLAYTGLVKSFGMEQEIEPHKRKKK